MVNELWTTPLSYISVLYTFNCCGNVVNVLAMNCHNNVSSFFVAQEMYKVKNKTDGLVLIKQ